MRHRHKRSLSILAEKYSPSAPCTCDVCRSYCRRPGWWTVAEAAHAIKNGYGARMMLELSPEGAFGVLSPAFKGCQQNFALQEYAHLGCIFYRNERCDLFGSGCVPLECRFCHHTRRGQGQQCHLDLERDWDTPAGRRLASQWAECNGLWLRYPAAMFPAWLISSSTK
jgi:hypothetical protein